MEWHCPVGRWKDVLFRDGLLAGETSRYALAGFQITRYCEGEQLVYRKVMTLDGLEVLDRGRPVYEIEKNPTPVLTT